MKHLIIGLMITGLFSNCCTKKDTATNQKFYDFKANTLSGKEISMSDYQGKVVLIVNTASKCGFTSQFEGLETLYKKYGKDGLVILGFPCNQFREQDPGSNKEIGEFCQRNYGVTFQMMEKVDVNGDDALPLYKYLKCKKKGLLGSSIKWNFTKFLIDKNGNPIKRFSTTTKPSSIEKYIIKELNK